MKHSSMLSRAFFRRPSVRALVPDYKLVLTVLVVGCESHAGVYIPGGLGEDTGLDPAPLRTALADLERHGHIIADEETGEVFICSFYRDNVFKTANRVGQWHSDFKMIESQKLRAAVSKAIGFSPECGLASAAMTPQATPEQDGPQKSKNHEHDKKQEDSSLGLGLVVDVGVEEELAAATAKEKTETPGSAEPPCACGAEGGQGSKALQLEGWLEGLMQKGAGRESTKHEQDRANVHKLRLAADELGFQTVHEAAGGAEWPTAAVKNCEVAGIFKKVEHVRRKRKEEEAREADLARQALVASTPKGRVVSKRAVDLLKVHGLRKNAA